MCREVVAICIAFSQHSYIYSAYICCVRTRGYTLSDVTPPIRLPVRVCRETQHSNSTKMGHCTSALRTHRDVELVQNRKSRQPLQLELASLGALSCACFPILNSFGSWFEYHEPSWPLPCWQVESLGVMPLGRTMPSFCIMFYI